MWLQGGNQGTKKITTPLDFLYLKKEGKRVMSRTASSNQKEKAPEVDPIKCKLKKWITGL